MRLQALRQARLHSLLLIDSPIRGAGALVAHMGAVQAQDYAHSKWALGIRLPGFSEADFDRAVLAREFVRTWAMRGTLHLIAAADVRWLLGLVGVPLTQRFLSTTRKVGLDEAAFAEARKQIARLLAGRSPMLRDELVAGLEAAGIPSKGLRGSMILNNAALHQVVCLGPNEGKQETVALLDEWLPPVPAKTRSEALGELALRYFLSHGPASLQDFVAWSSLNITDAKAGLESIKSSLHSMQLDGQTYWGAGKSLPEASGSIFLLPGFDEYVIGYRDRSPVLDPDFQGQVITINGIFRPVALVDGEVVGAWSRTIKPKSLSVELQPFGGLEADTRAALKVEAERYAAFMGRKLEGWD